VGLGIRSSARARKALPGDDPSQALLWQRGLNQRNAGLLLLGLGGAGVGVSFAL